MPRPIHIQNGIYHQAHVIETVIVRMNHADDRDDALSGPMIARACEAFAEMLDLFEMGRCGGGFTASNTGDDAQYHEAATPWWTLEQAAFTDKTAGV